MPGRGPGRSGPPWASVAAVLAVFSTLALAACVSETQQPSARLRNLAASRFLQVDGVSIHYYDWGETGAGTVLLFVHGWAGGGIEALPLAEELASRQADVRIIAVDLPGCGFSDRPDHSLGMGGYEVFLGRWLVTVRDQLAPGPDRRLVLWGHSLGGHMVLRALFDSRFGPVASAGSVFDRVERVVLCAPAGLQGEEGALLALRNRELMRLFYPLFTHEMYFQSARKNTYFDIGKVPSLVLDLGWAGLVYRGGMLTLGDITTDTLATAPLEGILGSFNLPVLLIWGRQDRVLDFKYSAVFAQELPDVRFHALDRCGHPAHIDRTGAVADLVEAFLAEEP